MAFAVEGSRRSIRITFKANFAPDSRSEGRAAVGGPDICVKDVGRSGESAGTGVRIDTSDLAKYSDAAVENPNVGGLQLPVTSCDRDVVSVRNTRRVRGRENTTREDQ